jgi:mono/diheme cytochrome c family protein
MRLLAVVALLSSSALPAFAQEVGDPKKGLDYAERNCAECHAVEAANTDSTNPDAPPFQLVARDPELSDLALTVFFQSPHEGMPDLIVQGADARDLIAYIRSLEP